MEQDGFYKAAVLLASLGEEEASEVMKSLDPKDLQKLGAKITELRDIEPEVLSDVYGEFIEISKEPESFSVEGKSYIQKVLTKALGDEQADRVIEGLMDPDEDGLDVIKWMDARSISSLIKGEHPQTVALILSNLDTTKSSEILPNLPDWLRADVMVRMATLKDIPPGVMQEIGAALQEELGDASANSIAGKKVSGVKLVADILNQVDSANEQAIVEAITKHDPDLAESIRALMFVFDDLAQLDTRGLQALLKDVNRDDLTLALRAAKEDIKTKFFGAMSERAAQLLKEDMDAKGPVKVVEVEKAQQMILKTAKRLSDAGTISIGGKGSGEELI